MPPPELHLLLGPVNTMYNGIEKVWPGVTEWSSKHNVIRSEYHGGMFEGNECRKLLKNIDSLWTLCPDEHSGYAQALEDFNEVVASCYGYDLEPDFEEKIAQFKSSYLRLDINVTPKVHAVFYHISEFCKYTGMGLGPWSEQTSESLHHDFNLTWKNYKVKNMDNSRYATELYKAVCMYNGKNL